MELIIGTDDVRMGLTGKPVFLRLLDGPSVLTRPGSVAHRTAF